MLPLALPSVFNSLRLIFGLAFGYIMLAEVVKFGGETGGLGDLINISQRRGPREHVLLILLIIPIVALVIDRLFFSVQAELFPYRYGGSGILNRLVRAVLHAWEDVRLLLLEARSNGCSGQPRAGGPHRTAYAMSRHRSSNRSPRRAAPPGQEIGIGRVLTGVRQPAEVREPHVVEFRDVTKTYQSGPGQRIHRDPRCDVSSLRIWSTRASSSACWARAAAARARSCG